MDPMIRLRQDQSSSYLFDDQSSRNDISIRLDRQYIQSPHEAHGLNSYKDQSLNSSTYNIYNMS